MTSLVKKIEQRLNTAGKHPRHLGVFVLFDSNDKGLPDRLRGLAKKEALSRVSLCIGAAPADYAVAKEADATVVVYTVGRRGQQKVTANFALRKGELDKVKSDAIVKALSDVLPK